MKRITALVQSALVTVVVGLSVAAQLFAVAVVQLLAVLDGHPERLTAGLAS